MFNNYDIVEMPLSVKRNRIMVENFLATNGLRLDDMDYYAAVVDRESYKMLAGGGFKEEEYKAYAQELGLNVVTGSGADDDSATGGTVHFLGYISEEEKIAAIKASDFLVMPSTSEAESFGIVQIEAMAFGKPVINTNLRSGVPQVSIHGETGLTIPPGDEDALYKAIKTLGENSNLRTAYGKAAYDRVRDHYTKKVMSAITRTAFEELLKK